MSSNELSGNWVQGAQNQGQILEVWIKRSALIAGIGLIVAVLGLWAGLRKAAGVKTPFLESRDEQLSAKTILPIATTRRSIS